MSLAMRFSFATSLSVEEAGDLFVDFCGYRRYGNSFIGEYSNSTLHDEFESMREEIFRELDISTSMVAYFSLRKEKMLEPVAEVLRCCMRLLHTYAGDAVLTYEERILFVCKDGEVTINQHDDVAYFWDKSIIDEMTFPYQVGHFDQAL